MGGPSQSLLDALHGVQLWGIVRSDTGGRCGSNDEFLVAFKRLEEEVSNVEEENAKLWELVHMMIERDDLLLCGHGCTPHTCKAYDSDVCERIGRLSDELGIEVE